MLINNQYQVPIRSLKNPTVRGHASSAADLRYKV